MCHILVNKIRIAYIYSQSSTIEKYMKDDYGNYGCKIL